MLSAWTCSRTPAHRLAASTGSAASFAAPGITLTVSSDATTQISARSADTVGNLSACSASLSYTEDSSAPPAPVLIGTDPGSPANENDPRVQGSAGGDANSVELYASTDCSGVLAATGTPAQLAGGGLSVEVTDDTTTSFSARSFDGINASQCSNSISYREDSTGPDTLFVGALPNKIKFQPRKRRRTAVRAAGGAVTFSFSADEIVPGYRCKLDGREWTPCDSPHRLTKLKAGPHVFSVRAFDLAGNLDPTPASRGFKVVRKRAKKRSSA